MLEHGSREASDYIVQLDRAKATTRRCPCGCANFDLEVEGKPAAPPGVHVLGDFVFGDRTNLAGIFVYSSAGILSGVEVYGLASDAPPNCLSRNPFGLWNSRSSPRATSLDH